MLSSGCQVRRQQHAPRKRSRTASLKGDRPEAAATLETEARLFESSLLFGLGELSQALSGAVGCRPGREE